MKYVEINSLTNILIINTNCSWNKGSAAQVVSTIEILKKFIPQASFTMISWIPSLDIKYSSRYNLKIIGYFGQTAFEPLIYAYHIFLSLIRCTLWKMLSKLKINANSLLNEKYLKAYSNTDIILDLSGDSLADNNLVTILNCIGILPGILLRKPIVLFSQSIGPFNMLNYPLVKFCLNNVNLITARGKLTKKYLENISIKAPIFLVADCAFILKSASHKRVKEILYHEGIKKEDYPLIGISVSVILDRKNNNYVNIMSQTIDYLIQKINVQIILISHSFLDTKDDRCVANKIYETTVNKSKIILIKNEYLTEELKGIIGLCDIFIGARMHTSIAALSICIPTIVIAWSPKYYEIMASLGQEKYICNINTLKFQELTSKIEELWHNRSKIRTELTSKMRIQRKLALFGGKLVEEKLRRREM